MHKHDKILSDILDRTGGSVIALARVADSAPDPLERAVARGAILDGSAIKNTVGGADKRIQTGYNVDGGPGSGNHGHAGNPGHRGGSVPRGSGGGYSMKTSAPVKAASSKRISSVQFVPVLQRQKTPVRLKMLGA